MSAVTRIPPPPSTVPLSDSFAAGQLLRAEVNRAVRAGVTLRHIAASSHVNVRTVSKLWHGETKHPRFDTIVQMLRHFGYQMEARR